MGLIQAIDSPSQLKAMVDRYIALQLAWAQLRHPETSPVWGLFPQGSGRGFQREGGWPQINWPKVHRTVWRLQVRIVKAARESYEAFPPAANLTGAAPMPRVVA